MPKSSGVVSNHRDLAPLVQPFKVPFTLIPIAKDTKAKSEAQLSRT